MARQSRFVWHDLNVPDPDKGQRFYGELFKWKFDAGKGDGYVHIKAGDAMIGGVRKNQPGEPPHWVGYVDVDDVAATVTEIEQAGGKIFMPTTKLENVGTLAACADPTGGVFCPWKSVRADQDKEPAGMPGPYTFIWDELLSTDVKKAVAFYTKVFGWGVKEVQMGPDAVYTLFVRTGVAEGMGGEKQAGGAWPSPAPHSFWVTYVSVPNADETAAQCKRLGGGITIEPADIPNVGRFASLTDDQGVHFGILQPKMS